MRRVGFRGKRHNYAVARDQEIPGVTKGSPNIAANGELRANVCRVVCTAAVNWSGSVTVCLKDQQVSSDSGTAI